MTPYRVECKFIHIIHVLLFIVAMFDDNIIYLDEACVSSQKRVRPDSTSRGSQKILILCTFLQLFYNILLYLIVKFYPNYGAVMYKIFTALIRFTILGLAVYTEHTRTLLRHIQGFLFDFAKQKKFPMAEERFQIFKCIMCSIV